MHKLSKKRKTYKLLPNINLSHSAKMSRIFRTTCIHELSHIYFSFPHLHFHLPILHLLFQPTTVQSIAFRKTLCTNLEICHTILPQTAEELTDTTHLIQFPCNFDSYKPQLST